MTERRRALAVVTDLDGCLLDARTYDFAPARPTLALLRRRGVPLVLCTTKTRAELAALFRALGSRHVAIVEDGGGVLVPAGALRARLPGARQTAQGRLLSLARPYAEVRRAFQRLRALTRGAVRGFGDMTTEDIAAVTGLDRAAARRAALREFDEPFVFAAGQERRWRGMVRRFAERRGLVVTRGGRFNHLHGPFDKGRAVRLVRALLERERGPLAVAALGDSPLDAPLLAAADLPVIVPRPDGRPDASLRRRMPQAPIAPAPGPAGWARAVTALVEAAARR
ncbi:MAG: mannosyl-3-phosphoglycerate phosphatase [Gemmatimonadetes bacterium]|nr:mannosyl-3-phosphoglycerate phosphatase [Gemmatimonadota bacterium]